MYDVEGGGELLSVVASLNDGHCGVHAQVSLLFRSFLANGFFGVFLCAPIVQTTGIQGWMACFVP